MTQTARRRRLTETRIPQFAVAASQTQTLPRLGEFTVLRELGRGGMGVVYEAHDPARDERVALKVLLPDRGGELDVERFQDEARLTASLRHPGIVRVESLEHDGATWFMVMELIPGEDLQSRIVREGPLSADETVAISLQIADALAHAHSEGILHRDLKPHNVLLDAAGQARLTDFGLAKLVSSNSQLLTTTGRLVGTPAYLSPEQVLGRELSVRSDVYGLGATLYQMLTGEVPYSEAGSLTELVRAIAEDPPISPRQRRPEVPVELEAICLKCLEKDPRDRYASAVHLARDLRAYLAGLRVRAQRTRPAELLRWLRRNRRHVLGGVAIAAGAVLVAGLARSTAPAAQPSGGAPELTSLLALASGEREDPVRSAVAAERERAQGELAALERQRSQAEAEATEREHAKSTELARLSWELEQAQANLAETQAQLDAAERGLERTTDLLNLSQAAVREVKQARNTGVQAVTETLSETETELEQAQAAAQAAEARALAAEAEAKRLTDALRKARIEARRARREAARKPRPKDTPTDPDPNPDPDPDPAPDPGRFPTGGGIPLGGGIPPAADPVPLDDPTPAPATGGTQLPAGGTPQGNPPPPQQGNPPPPQQGGRGNGGRGGGGGGRGGGGGGGGR